MDYIRTQVMKRPQELERRVKETFLRASLEYGTVAPSEVNYLRAATDTWGKSMVVPAPKRRRSGLLILIGAEPASTTNDDQVPRPAPSRTNTVMHVRE